jgi:hypothetical protein
MFFEVICESMNLSLTGSNSFDSDKVLMQLVSSGVIETQVRLRHHCHSTMRGKHYLPFVIVF